MKTVKRIKAICRQCGNEFDAYNYRNIYCSKKCAEKERSVITRAKIGETVTCPGCGKTFEKKHGKQEYCSTECQKISNFKRTEHRDLKLTEEKKIIRRSRDSKFNISKCKKCRYKSGQGDDFSWCNYSGITGRTCLRLKSADEVIDIRGEDYDNCLLFVKGKKLMSEDYDE